jgi:DNA-binding beta-propeller fold protein YncE
MLPPIRNESHRTSSSRSGRVRRLLDTRHPLGVEGVPAPGVTGGGGSVRPTFGGNAVWFASSSGQTLSKLDPETVATTQTYQVGHGPSGIAVGQGGVWVANSRDGTVSRVDPTSGQVRTISVGPAPGGVVAAYGAVWVSPYEPRS